MSDEKFNAIVNGPLSHPFFPFRLSRALTALRLVVEATGQAGEDALLQVAQKYDEKDAGADGEGGGGEP